MDVFNPQHWVDSSGGLTKGKLYGAPHVDVSSLRGVSRYSSASAQQGCTSTPTPSTQPIHTQFSLEEIVQRVLDKLTQSPGIPMQSTVHTQTTDRVAVSSQTAVPTSPYIPDQSTMPTEATVPTQATMPTQSQQMGFSPFNGTFPHFTGHRSMSSGAYPSQQSSLHSNTFGTAQQSMQFFDLMQQQLPHMQQYSHMQQFLGPSMSYQPYQSSRNLEEHQHHGSME